MHVVNQFSKSHSTSHQIRMIRNTLRIYILWESYSRRQGYSKLTTSQQLVDIADEFSLHQLVSEPTRKDKILDLFFISYPIQSNIDHYNTLAEKSTDSSNFTFVRPNISRLYMNRPNLLNIEPR